MEKEKKKCFLKEHKKFDSTIYCQECKVYMCNKCEIFHFSLFKNIHHFYTLDKNIKEISTGFCKEENHFNELKYFCINHNKLCCAACIAKIKGEGNGQHSDCNICFIKEIKNEKKNILNENIKILKNLTNDIEKALNKLHNLFEKTLENIKEELKKTIEKIFRKIRIIINDREDISDAHKLSNTFNCNEDIIKKREKLLNLIKISLEKGKLLDKDWKDNNKLKPLVIDCINLKKNADDINLIYINIVKLKTNTNNLKFKFFSEEKEEILKLLEIIHLFVYYKL